jgi:archaellum biogenesis protein FlaJ (TadC family)
MADKRRKEVEDVLPDALQLISANIKSGLTIEKAFLLSARDEFGPLAVDLRQGAMQMFGGTPVEDVLEDMSKSTKSELFQETIRLLQDGIESGGKVSQLLEASSRDIRKSLHLREEIAANVQMYSMFILAASLFGAPILFSVSVFLTERTTSLWAGQNLQNLPDAGGGFFNFSAPSLEPAFFADFAMASIIISNIFAALIISEIKNGTVKDGLKYIPLLVIVAVVIFSLTNVVLTSALGSFA